MQIKIDKDIKIKWLLEGIQRFNIQRFKDRQH